MQPIVDVVIAVHSSTRPIARAVASVLQHNHTPTRVIVVAHNIDPQMIRHNLGPWADDERVLLHHLADGIHSPAGPMNHGLDTSSASFVSLMGSDDELQPGAIDAWFSLQRQSGAHVVIPQVRDDRGGRELSPPARPRRCRRLDPVKDRLSYRSAPLGLMSRQHIAGIRLVEGLRSGEDLPFVTRLWFSGANIAFARTDPGYLVRTDAVDRVTSDPRPIDDDFAFLDHIIDAPELTQLTPRDRHAIAVKLLRIHLFDALINRADAGEWPVTERQAISTVITRILRWGDRPERSLSLLDRAIVDLLQNPTTPMGPIMERLGRRSRYASIPVLVTKNPLRMLTRQAPLRTFAAAYFL